jgi:hypothetical protein
MAAAVRAALAEGAAREEPAAAAPAPPAPETTLAPALDVPAAANAAPAAPEAPPAGVPAEAQPAPAPAAPPQPSRAPSRRVGRRGLIAGAVTILALAAIAAVLAIELGGGGSASGSASNRPVSLLDALVPTGIAKQCSTQTTPSYHAVETELCHPPANAPTSFPQSFSFSFFRSKTTLLHEYSSLASGLVVGNCGDTKGSQTWIHHSTGKTGGLRVCGADASGDAMIVWTHEKLGSFDHVNMLGVAKSSARGANIYRGWWAAVKDDIGKCRPLLPIDTCNATVRHFENGAQ